jgi:hypothetical protein
MKEHIQMVVCNIDTTIDKFLYNPKQYSKCQIFRNFFDFRFSTSLKEFLIKPKQKNK